ncbi:hypothetical protein N7532_007524 [Penicillium argentinense]|uniref:Uncharacterized protein n=1 Tax=Penicillium argentinense TaxID=1131581 RepID=A0A9W9K6R2_9EURO|nr:uncharacterized protein N7532_007524 [Penicillium argentinense]KAJ5095233.1 hypothetical protein N7532_007524 [Penicillium argentinense]
MAPSQQQLFAMACICREKRVLGDDHLDTLDTHIDLANVVYGERGRYNKVEHCVQVIAGLGKALGDIHTRTVEMQEYLAGLKKFKKE